ncbi:MAG TPA: hypothetical protein VLD37_03555 [Candidatus Bilamarchaeum sp.]|nr:hypothetical protein [Candidatus Bilamarchaeum sp.]
MRSALFLVIAASVLIAGCCSAPEALKGPGGDQGAPTGGAQTGGTSGGSSPSGATTNLNECQSSCESVYVADQGLKMTCKAGCQMNAAEETGDAGKCDPILGYGENATLFFDTCIISVAEAKSDASVCSKAKDQMYNNLCLSNIAEAKGDASICGQIKDDTYKNICYSSVAESKKDPSICNSISDQYYKESCIDGAK